MDKMCLDCLARIKGYSCPGVEADEECLSATGPIYTEPEGPIKSEVPGLEKKLAVYLVSEMTKDEDPGVESRTTPFPEMAHDLAEIFKDWLRSVGLTDYFTLDKLGLGFNATESIRKLLITLVDEPSTRQECGRCRIEYDATDIKGGICGSCADDLRSESQADGSSWG